MELLNDDDDDDEPLELREIAADCLTRLTGCLPLSHSWRNRVYGCLRSAVFGFMYFIENFIRIAGVVRGSLARAHRARSRHTLA